MSKYFDYIQLARAMRIRRQRYDRVNDIDSFYRHIDISNSIKPIGDDNPEFRGWPIGSHPWWPKEYFDIYVARKPNKQVTKVFSNYLYRERYGNNEL